MAFRHPLRKAIATNNPAAIGIPSALIRMDSPVRIPQKTVARVLASFSFALAANTQAPSASAANGMSDIRFAEKNNTLGFSAQPAVSTSAAVSLKPGSLRRNENAAIKYATPNPKFIATAAERFSGNAAFQRHTQDNIHGYKNGILGGGRRAGHARKNVAVPFGHGFR